MAHKNDDYYIRLRERIILWLGTKKGRNDRWGQYLLLGPDLLHLMCKLAGDKDVAYKDKLRLGIAIIYFFSPVDLLPEIILGPIGYLDDIAIAAFALNSIINRTPPEVVHRHWAGEEDVLGAVRRIIAAVDKAIGSGLWQKIRQRIG